MRHNPTPAFDTHWSRELVGSCSIIQRAEGTFQIGLAEGTAGPFETRTVAEAVAKMEALRVAS